MREMKWCKLSWLTWEWTCDLFMLRNIQCDIHYLYCCYNDIFSLSIIFVADRYSLPEAYHLLTKFVVDSLYTSTTSFKLRGGDTLSLSRKNLNRSKVSPFMKTSIVERYRTIKFCIQFSPEQSESLFQYVFFVHEKRD